MERTKQNRTWCPTLENSPRNPGSIQKTVPICPGSIQKTVPICHGSIQNIHPNCPNLTEYIIAAQPLFMELFVNVQ